MQSIETASDVRDVLRSVRARAKRIALVPTMGALHEGHSSLVNVAQRLADYVVMSIFVNPMQFNNPDDLAHYPRMLETDLDKASGAGVDLVFAPSVAEIYPRGVPSAEPLRSAYIRAGDCSLPLEGRSRPGHFDGVVTVVGKLFNVVLPDIAVFGAKDYQQVKVIEQYVTDLAAPVEIVSAPIVRERDGLALSSRNLRLSAEQRYHALYIPRSLEKAREMVEGGERDAARLCQVVAENIERSGGLRLDYAEIVHVDTLQKLNRIDDVAQLLVAAYADEIRLIDNIRLCPSGIGAGA